MSECVGSGRGQGHYEKPEYVSSDTAPVLPKGRKHTSHICIRAAAGRAVSPSGRLNRLQAGLSHVLPSDCHPDPVMQERWVGQAALPHFIGEDTELRGTKREGQHTPELLIPGPSVSPHI